ncbi:MAG: glycosyltransferase [Candidatus Midichloria sp.]|nr:MAG: glycosyltransferase [Candidatus Midichloria sp.]
MDCKISIIVPVYNEENAIGAFIDNILTVMNKLTNDFEIIFINDGSSDNTLKNVITKQKNYLKLK